MWNVLRVWRFCSSRLPRISRICILSRSGANIKLSAGTRFNLIPSFASPVTWHLLVPKGNANPLENAGLFSFTEELPSPYTYQPVSVPFYLKQILDCWFTRQTDACHLMKSSHKFYELIYVYEGSLTISLASGTHSLCAHDLIIYHSDNADIQLDAGCSYLTIIFDVSAEETFVHSGSCVSLHQRNAADPMEASDRKPGTFLLYAHAHALSLACFCFSCSFTKPETTRRCSPIINPHKMICCPKYSFT